MRPIYYVQMRIPTFYHCRRVSAHITGWQLPSAFSWITVQTLPGYAQENANQ